MMNRLLCILFLLFMACHVHADPAVPDPAGKDFDLQGFIDGEIKAGKHKIVVPPGRYRVKPHSMVHLQFKKLHDLEILADGVEMVCTETTQALNFDECRNVRFKGLVIDYDPLPFTEGRIVSMPPDKSWMEFELIDGYPENEFEMRIELFDQATRELKRVRPNFVHAFTKVGPRRYRLVKTGYQFNPATDTEEVGDILVTNNIYAPNGSAAHTVVLNNCQNMVIEDVTVYASNCFGFLESGCDNTTYLHCHVDRRPPETDLVKRGFPRMRSLDADCYHAICAFKGPSLIGCSAKFAADDCLNINGLYYMTAACDGTDLRILADKNINIEAGDHVEFLPFSGTRPPDPQVMKIVADVPPTEQEKEFIRTHGIDARIVKALSGPRAVGFKITLDRATKVPMGSLVCSGRRVGNGFLVKDCDFGYNRSRGILIKASKGQVVGNKVTHTWEASVLVAPEYAWMEAASSSDIVIKDNVIDGCLRTAIDVQADGGDGKPLPAGAHSHIAITGNTVTRSPWPNISIASAVDSSITGNTLVAPGLEDTLSPLARRWNWKSDTPSPVITINCDRTIVENNH